MGKNTKILIGALLFMAAGMHAEPTAAGIKCKGPNQVSSYGLIPSRYCEDVYLARLAGMPPKAVLYNPSAKEAACNRVGHDNRVSHICQGHGFRNDAFGR